MSGKFLFIFIRDNLSTRTFKKVKKCKQKKMDTGKNFPSS